MATRLDNGLFEMTLRDSRTVTVENFEVTNTYSGCVLGSPTQVTNKTYLLECFARAESRDPHIPLRLFKPENREGVRLPRLACFVLLTCSHPNPRYPDLQIGTALKVLWFQDEIDGLPRVPESVLAAIDWDGEAIPYMD